MSVSEFNAAIIEEFRANNGKVGGGFEGVPILLVHHRGARTGTERVNPVTYQSVGDDFAVFAAKDGAPTHPDWYYNLVANPETTIEVGTETIAVRARVAEGDEREAIWTRQKTLMPAVEEYERAAGGRQIPVIVLERQTS